MSKTKISNAGYRMLEVLKALTHTPLSSQEILEYLEETLEIDYRKEIVLKYINTIKFLDINVSKTNGKYYLQKSLQCTDFNKRDLSILTFIKKYIEKINQEDLKENIIETLQIIEQNFSQRTINLIEKSNIHTYRPLTPIQICDKNINQFEEYCKDELKLEIQYQNEFNSLINTYIIAPVRLIYRQSKAFLIAYYPKNNEYKEFLLENILETKQLPQKQIKGSPSSVLFKLKNRLAKSYVLKNNETVLENTKDYLIISNKNEDKELLLRRLLRYYNQCEILYPKVFRDEFINTIEAMEKMYEQNI